MFKKVFCIDNKPYITNNILKNIGQKQIMKGVLHILVPYHSFL